MQVGHLRKVREALLVDVLQVVEAQLTQGLRAEATHHLHEQLGGVVLAVHLQLVQDLAGSLHELGELSEVQLVWLQDQCPQTRHLSQRQPREADVLPNQIQPLELLHVFDEIGILAEDRGRQRLETHLLKGSIEDGLDGLFPTPSHPDKQLRDALEPFEQGHHVLDLAWWGVVGDDELQLAGLDLEEVASVPGVQTRPAGQSVMQRHAWPECRGVQQLVEALAGLSQQNAVYCPQVRADKLNARLMKTNQHRFILDPSNVNLQLS